MELTYKTKTLSDKLKARQADLKKEAEAWVEKKKVPRANAIEKLEALLAYAKDPEKADKPKFRDDQAVSGRFQGLLEQALEALPGEGATVDKAPQAKDINSLQCRIDTLDNSEETEVKMEVHEYSDFIASCEDDCF